MNRRETDASALTGPEWWYFPEYRSVIAAACFGPLGLTGFAENLLGPASTACAMMLLGLSAGRIESYENPARQASVYFALLSGILITLFISLWLAEQFWFFVMASLTIFLFLTGLGIAMTMIPRPVKVAPHDRSLIYSDHIDSLGPSFAAKRIRYWPFITLIAIVAALTFTGSPAWAILTGASLLVFTPLAFPRNPATARPVLIRILNIFALCLIAAAAYSLTL
ncbi:MAG: hypothetical protein AAF386_00185 [Pseudomonadota bacterium]